MDPSKYRTLTVSRGFAYNVYYAPAAAGQPTLLLLHGFPSTSYDWHRQVFFFAARGVGVVAPDLLGAGATSKPADPLAFRQSAMAHDVVELLDALGLHKIVGIGHDWGSVLLSRLSMLHQDRFLGFAWLGLGFLPVVISRAEDVPDKPSAGPTVPAYWEFFTRKDAGEVIRQNADSFLQLLYPQDPACWATWILTKGKTAELIENGILLGCPGWLSDEEYGQLKQNIETHGVASSLLWYTCEQNGGNLEDSTRIPTDAVDIKVPALFVGTSKDIVSVESLSLPLMQKYATNLQTASLPAGHWVQVECADELNSILEKWLTTISL
ncbi:alpha/beta hydrolase [Phanerochaete sordida]|uniref:Alpha/beta hydrolase n=1 Tax=Phanerochaete sordida TaxID=48140 RepID=A0A9P3GH73_9APHY|nr:alpha/beta hydrolase [Phanerochaete sordida]